MFGGGGQAMRWKLAPFLLLSLVLLRCDSRPRERSIPNKGWATANGRVCLYCAIDKRVLYAVVFDTRDGRLNVTRTRTQFWDREGSEEEAEDQIWTADGQWFS